MQSDMKLARFFILFVSAIALPSRAEPPAWSGSPDASLTVKTLPGMMRYDQNELTAEPGAKIKLTIENPDDLQHNFVLLKADPKDKDGQKFAQDTWMLGEKVVATGWVPVGNPRILAASALLNPAASEALYFVAPEEPGEYPYVCTVPGHSLLMRGVLKVHKAGAAQLKDLTYSIYQGDWNKLPDFSKLTPVETGKLPQGRIDLAVAKKHKGGIGIVFEGKLIVSGATAEDFHFFVASDDGSRVVVDGEGIVEDDGVHPIGNPKEGKVKLPPGEHTVRVLYFDKSRDRALTVGLRAKSLGWADLSVVPSSKKAAKPAQQPILLTPKGGEAITHRAFLPNVNPRGIAVGYPGGINLAWDADALNLAMIWRGGFLNVAPHWEGRGSGSQPSGYDQVRTGAGLPMQQLESLDEPWVATSTATILNEKDTDTPKKEMTFNVKHPDYQFLGYRLDPKNRFPTFRYRYREAKVTESFAPAEIEGREALVRKIAFTGAIPKETWFRLADTGSLEKNDSGWYAIDANLWLKVEGSAEPTVRTAGKKELIVPVAESGERVITVTYWWQTKIGGRVK